MQSKNVALAVLASALLSTSALAQSSPPASSPSDTKSPPAATQPAKPSTGSSMESTTSTTTPSTAMGQWRASKFVGLDVYNANNEKIGDINEMLFDSSGKISTVVIGVGGFLGMGEHNVGLPFEQVKFVNEPVKSTTGTATTGTGTTATSANKDFPDHAMVNMTKDQLKALPAFKYASDTSSSTTRTSPAPATPPARSPAPPANTSK